MEVEVAVLAFLSLTVLMVSVDAERHGLRNCGRRATSEEKEEDTHVRVQELCESRGGRPGLPSLAVLNGL